MVDYGDVTLLLMGDAENLRIEEFAGLGYQFNEKVILKVPHHGNYHKKLKNLLEAYKFDAAVICCSKDEPEAAELQKTVDLLENMEIYLTSKGTVTLEVSEEGYSISQ